MAQYKQTVTKDIVANADALGVRGAHLEYRFHPTRKWRFDIAWPDRMLAVEIDGGVWTGGRHTTGAGFERDAEKINVAQALGWLVVRITPQMWKRAPQAIVLLLRWIITSRVRHGDAVFHNLYPLGLNDGTPGNLSMVAKARRKKSSTRRRKKNV